MKMIVLIVLICISSKLIGQIDTSQEIYILDPTPPAFSGGEDSLFCFLEQNFNYNRLNSNDYIGKAIVTFDVDTMGNLFNIQVNPEKYSKYEIYKRLVKDSIVEYEINRVFQLMPKWKPGFQNGHKFIASMTMLINLPYTDFRCQRYVISGAITKNVDVLADFKGFTGDSKKERINNYIYSKLKWISEPECYGMVYVQCVIEDDGSISNIRIIRGLCVEHDMEALRVVKLMPKWIPAIKDGKAVRSLVVIPIRFALK